MSDDRTEYLNGLAARIKALSPSQQLHLAADLMECAKGQTRERALDQLRVASSIARKVSDELRLALFAAARKEDEARG